MKSHIGVLISDQVSRAGIRVPASELMAAEERGRIARAANDLPAGTPTHMQHDMHRLIGWTYTLRHLIDGSMVRAIGITDVVETDQEKADLAARTAKYWDWVRESGGGEFRKELLQKLTHLSLDGATYERVEAYAVARPGLAAELYPELFAGKAVDKDGRTDYRTLTKRLNRVQPGVFEDSERGLVLFAHRHFRRSLSHRNKLNEYLLQSFDQTDRELPAVIPRLRLDPDLVGHAGSVRSMIELEHWHGPKFTDDIASIPSGSALHKADGRTREYEGVDRTHFWWKSPETRREPKGELTYRTFEVEELVEDQSPGLPDGMYGCRYAHAEYSPAVSAITHFDGAIRAYPEADYMARIDNMIDHAGKYSVYTKLFRFDGPMPVASWKRLLSDYFRGNPLIPEYLGASPREPDSPVQTSAHEQFADEPEKLSAFIALADDSLKAELGIEVTPTALPNGLHVAAVETGCGAVHSYIRSKLDIPNAIFLEPVQGTLNLARLGFGASPALAALMSEVVARVADALIIDAKDFGLERVSVALSWPFGDMIVLLSLRGTPEPLVTALRQLLTVVDPTKPPSEWIERLAELVQRLAPRSTPVCDLWDVTEGMLTCRREVGTQLHFQMDEKLAQKLMADGVFISEPPEDLSPPQNGRW